MPSTTRRILKDDPSRGIPALWEAQDFGDTYYIQPWKRQAKDRDDIRALWNHEVRSLMRLNGYPGAATFFVRLRDLGGEEGRYFVVLDGAGRVSLS